MGTTRTRRRTSTFVFGFSLLCLCNPAAACITADSLTVDLADANGDNALDFREMFDVLIERASCAESPVHTMTAKLIVHMDRNEDGLISFSEFESREPFDNGIPDPDTSLFEDADVDKNLVVTSAELVQSLTAMAVPALMARAQTFIERRDTDGSGTLNDAELNAARRIGPNGPRN